MKHKAKKTKKSQVKQMKLTMERYHMKSFHLFYDPSNKAKHGHSVYGNSEAENTIPEDFKSNDLPENIKNDDSENDVIPKNIDNEDPIEYILRPVEDPLESLLKKKKNKKFYDSWDDLESDPNQSRTESLCSDPIVTDAEFNEDEENEGIPLRIDTLH